MDILTSILPSIVPYVVPVVLLLFACSLWSYYVNSTRDHNSSLPLPPGTVGFPFVGETFNMIFKGWNFYKDRREKYGHVYKTHILGKPTIRIWGTENVRKVLSSEDTLVTMNWPTSVKKLMGEHGLITSTHRIHATRRATIMRAFSNNAINGYAKGMEDIVTRRLRTWCEKGNVMATEECRKLAFEVTARMLLGCDFSDTQMCKMNTCMNTIVDNFFTLPIDVPGFGFHKAMNARNQLLKTLDEIICNQHKPDPGRTDALKILYDEVQEGRLTMDELKDTIIEMLFSAFHGMTSLCCSAFMELSRHQEVVEKMTEELQKHGLLNHGDLTPDKMAKMPYLQAVCKELLRFSPPYGGGFRQVLKTFELEGHQIPKGWTVLYSIRDQHEVDENFENASVFNPERWIKHPNNEAYIPFGGHGKRSCVGEKYMSTFTELFVCQIIRGSQWELGRPDTQFTYFPVQMPTNGLPLRFTSAYRKSQST